MNKKKQTFLLFCLLQLTYWACFAAFNAYFVALMLDTGMTSTRISLIPIWAIGGAICTMPSG